MPRRKRAFTAHRPDANVYFPFGRKPEMRDRRLTNPVCFTEEPSGWPHMEFKSMKFEHDRNTSKEDVPREEQFDKYAPAEKAMDTDLLIFQYVSLMNVLEKANIGMCCDRVFFEETRQIKKSLVQRRPNCPKLIPLNELNIFGPDAVKPPEARKRRPPTPPIKFKKPKNPFDLSVDEVFPKQKPFVIASNRRTRMVPKKLLFGQPFDDMPCCEPIQRVKTYGCY